MVLWWKIPEVVLQSRSIIGRCGRLVSFYQRHNSEKLSEKEEDGTPVIDTILSKASTYTKATAEAYKQKYDAAPELTEPTGDMVTLTAEQARAVWACVAQ